MIREYDREGKRRTDRGTIIIFIIQEESCVIIIKLRGVKMR